MKNFPAGMHISVLSLGGNLLKARITRGSRGRIRYKVTDAQAASSFQWRPLLPADEGVTWARGWEGQQVDALGTRGALLGTRGALR